MRKIDPKELLDCLDSLLGNKGGIKGESEVKRMADLMTKFSKKLVSKCIYIQILKNTDPDLLIKFMAEGGWALVFQWLDESIGNNNSALIREILELLLICPISLDRLKENNCPKVVKSLSKDSDVEEVRKLACKLVEKWLKFIKSGQAAISDVAMAAAASTGTPPKTTITVPPSKMTVVSSVPSSVITTNNIKKVTNIPRKISKPGIQIVRDITSSEGDEGEEDEVAEEEEEEDDDNDNENENEDIEDDDEFPPIGSLPLYKITMRDDGKSVLAKVGTKTLTLPISKKAESETDSNSVTSLILKSDLISKKFRYVTKSVPDKEKSGVSQPLGSEIASREKSENKTDEKLRTTPLVVVRRIEDDDSESKSPSDCYSLERAKSKVSDSVLKTSSKTNKDGKVKDDQIKSSKIHRDRDNYKSVVKHKVKEKKDARDSEKDRRRSDHKVHSSSSSVDKVKDKDRDKEQEKRNKELSKDRHKDSDKNKSRDKDVKSKDSKDMKTSEKTLTPAEKAQMQADKDKDTLERLKTPTISVLGKIPKKSSSLHSTMTPVNTETAAPKPTLVKQTDSPQPGDKVSKVSGEIKKSVESRTSRERPKTVKTFHSKFRSTGLEEEIKPPPSRNSIKKKINEKRPALKSEKYSLSSNKEEQPPEKKQKVAEILADLKKDKIVEKPGAIKLIPPKPKPALLESDMFSDALTASTKLEPRKRKRRVSNSKEGPEIKKEVKEENSSQEVTPTKEVKPALKFYRDTLEDEDERSKENASDKVEIKVEADSNEQSKPSSSSDESSSKLYPNGVLVYKAKKGPKKSVKWKEEADLTTVRYFELDENERVNVTRNFVDMKLMERTHEREAFQLARKLVTDDIMEERIPWGPLYEVDVPPERRPPVEPGKASQEKSVQYAREKTVLQAIYFHRNSIPDSPAEPDVEIHPTTDPKIIPLEDITGNNDSIANFTNIPWPEPKPAVISTSPPPQIQLQHNLQQQQQVQPQGFGAGYSTVGNFATYPTVGMPGMLPPGQGTWRTGDGKDMGMNVNYQANGPMCPPTMNQPPGMFNPHGPEGFNMNGPPMGNFTGGFPMNCDPNMYGPPPMNMGGPHPPPQWNRGWQGGGRGHYMSMNMPPKLQKGQCHHFTKFGHCNRGNSCRFMHSN